jgi:hypothetical protein
LLGGKRVEYPRLLDVMYKKALRAREKEAVPMALPLGGCERARRTFLTPPETAFAGTLYAML